MGNRKSRDLKGETTDQLEKRIAGSRWVKTADQLEKIDRRLKVGKNRGENAGSKVQSPIWGTGVTHIWPRYGFDMGLIWHKPNSSIGGGS